MKLYHKMDVIVVTVWIVSRQLVVVHEGVRLIECL